MRFQDQTYHPHVSKVLSIGKCAARALDRATHRAQRTHQLQAVGEVRELVSHLLTHLLEAGPTAEAVRVAPSDRNPRVHI